MRSAPSARRSLGAALTVVAAAALLTPSVATAAPASVPAQVELLRSRTSLLGTHTWYQQTYQGVPVLGGWYAVHADSTGLPAAVDGRKPVAAGLSVRPAVAAATASARAAAKTPTAAVAPATLAIRPAADGAPAALVWRVVAATAGGSVETLVDAGNGSVLSTRSLVRKVDGFGRVFEPNPSVTLGTQELEDRDDSAQKVFVPAYTSVRLTDLWGSGMLRGRFARVMNEDSAVEPTNRFYYVRSDDRFEQVMAYHHVTSSQRYIQKLGFVDVNNESQDLYTNTITADNSYYDPANDEIVFGSGGVDDAEDADIIWHEYGHAIQDDQVPGFGSSFESAAIGEGFGDYWAVTMSVPVNLRYDVPCVGDWDATSYTADPPHCLRRVDGSKTVADQVGEPHADGEIWSRALWDLQKAIGRRKADAVILESQFRYAPDTSFRAAASATVATARALYGNEAASAARKAFSARGIVP